MTTPSTPQSELERLAIEKQASERDQARMTALHQYKRVVQQDQEEQELLFQNQEARMTQLVQDIRKAGLSDVIDYAASEVQPTRNPFSPSQEDVKPAIKMYADDDRPFGKGDKMRLLTRRKWLEQELMRMESCSGAPKPKMRMWLTRLRAARK
ncbi:MAG: hypothetical protein GY702_07295, partial [Desulfobulbaceae bacterium]|nr:hypothetical protein [Desulfobulbaceae bacterium]